MDQCYLHIHAEYIIIIIACIIIALHVVGLGYLVVKNKALGGGRSTARITRRFINRSTSHRPMKKTVSEEGIKLDQISEVRVVISSLNQPSPCDAVHITMLTLTTYVYTGIEL